MNAATALIFIKALFAIAPLLITAIVNGQVQKGTADEISAALSANWQKRLDAAKNAKETAVEQDPYNRDNA